MTTTQRHAIFREKALKHYTQGRKKDVLPSFGSISAGFFAWLLLGFLIATALVAWYGQVPIFLSGSGIVLGNNNQAVSSANGANALAFFSPDQASQLSAGDTVRVQFENSNTHIDSTIAQVLPGTTDLTSALARYGLKLGASTASGQQVAVALIALGSDASTQGYTGSTIVVEVNVGTQSLFSALTGIKIS
ncbi:MAG TPA: hypothetical protein VGD98_04035 [Ktedonobacteraceae bacterium]